MTSWVDPSVVLLDGRSVSSSSPEWRAECLDRHNLVLMVMRKDDRDSRRAFIANYEGSLAKNPPSGVTDPVAYAREARRRLEAAVLDKWERDRAARHA